MCPQVRTQLFPYAVDLVESSAVVKEWSRHFSFAYICATNPTSSANRNGLFDDSKIDSD
jgi:hypothetical protein